MRKLWIAASLSALLAACNADNLQPLQGGQFAPPPQTVTLEVINYTPAQGKAFKDLFVTNLSVKASQGQLLPMTARDGLPDALKTQLSATYGFTVGPSAYSVNPGFSDFLLSLMGVQFAQQSLLNCATNLQQSASNDALIFPDRRQPGAPMAFLGLRDCEKLYLGLNPAKFDNNGNGIPDYLKLRCGLNPKNTNDYKLNITGDGVTNYDKCKEHIPIDENANSQPNGLFAYKYNFEVHPDGTQNLMVSNIPILNGGQDNLIALYLVETDLTTLAPALYTAFTILSPGANGLILKFNYWATDPSKYTNQEIIPQ